MKELIIQGIEQAYQNLVHMLAEFLPRLVVMLVIVAVGFLVALALKYILRGLLHLTKLDRLSEQAGASHALRMAALPSITELLSQSVFWVTWSGFVLIGVSVLGVAGLQEQISRLFLLLPAIFVAISILFLGLVTANFLSRAVLLAMVNAGYHSPKLLSWSVRILVWILAVSMALEEIGIARQTVVAAFSIVFGALMLAMAIAFGLGGRHLARRFLERLLGQKEKEKHEEPQPL
jgi:Conserved TM helix